MVATIFTFKRWLKCQNVSLQDAYCVVAFQCIFIANVIVAPNVLILAAVLSEIICVGFNSVLSSTSVELLPNPLCGCFLSRSKLLFSDLFYFRTKQNVKRYIPKWESVRGLRCLKSKPGPLANYLSKPCRTFKLSNS